MRELLSRQAALTVYGTILLALFLPAAGAQLIDPRTLDGVNVWAKPAKFLLSVAVFSLTMAWTFGYVRPERRGARAMRWLVIVLIGAGSFELSYIIWQAAHGLASHFNISSLFYVVMYGLMGVGAVSLVATTLPMAWEIARRPVAGMRGDYRASVIIGLVFCFALGGGFGMIMAQGTGHSVGAVGGHAPLFGWNRCGGDLRIPHFLGIHAQQAIPLLAIMAAALSGRLRWLAVIAGSAIYAVVTIALFTLALAGEALLPSIPGQPAPTCVHASVGAQLSAERAASMIR